MLLCYAFIFLTLLTFVYGKTQYDWFSVSIEDTAPVMLLGLELVMLLGPVTWLRKKCTSR